MKNIPVITFIQRTWLLIAAALITNWLTLTKIKFSFLGQWEFDEMKGGIWVPQTPFDHFGAILYVPPFALTVLIFALLAIHLFYRQTIDEDVNNGTYLTDWRACTSFQRVLVSNIVRIGFIIGFCILCSGLARGSDTVDQVARWNRAAVNPKCTIALDVAVKLYQRNAARYQTVQAMRKNGAPATVLFCLHYRESDNSFLCSPAQGDPLTHRSTHVPRGRIPDKEPPYSWEVAAFDSYYVCDRLDLTDWSRMQTALQEMEAFNGTGYQRRGVPSPYLWSGTTLYKAGKFVSDGHYSATALDRQLGCVAILKRMQERGVAIPFASYDTKAK